MIRGLKLVHGVGINDADYKVYVTDRVNGKQVNTWTCPFYRAWASMLERCYSEAFRNRCPTYLGCSTISEWHSFSVFREWMSSQEWHGKSMDKDLLRKDNRVYSPDVCIFISHALNCFLTDSRAARGEWPIGVYQNRDGRFKAQCNDPFRNKREGLGEFDNPDSAHMAWRKRKHQHALRYADMQTDDRIASALRTRYLMEDL